MAAMTDTCDCREIVRSYLASCGVEATVSTEPPIVRTPYDFLGMTCPHGVTWYTEPTSEQVAKWAAEGTR